MIVNKCCIVVLIFVTKCIFATINEYVHGENETAPVRNTTYGPIKGFVHAEENIQAEVYLGVPYARPPVEKLRFENPQAPEPWSTILNATEQPPWCVQFWYEDGRIEKRKMDEDCLYLNLFIPANVNGANMFPMEGGVRNLVSKGIIFVTINYRLGPLGFLSTLSADLPGNYGLEDQIMALQWVQQNIERFDGDPNRITVGGESAGASSASILAISPRTKGLFQRAMIRSGSSVAPWAVRSQNTDLNSLLVIRRSHCEEKFHNMTAVKECLKHSNHPFLAHTYFTPVVDSYRGGQSVIPDYPYKLIQEGAHLPVMMGVTTAECAAYVTWLYFLATHDTVYVDVRNNLEFVVPSVQYANPEQVKQAVSARYIWGSDAYNNFPKVLVKIASDQNFVSPAAVEANLYMKKGADVYLYIFEHSNTELDAKQAMYGVHNVGSGHGYDMVFIFQSTKVVDPVGKTLNWSHSDLFVTEFLSQTMTNFVASGDPGHHATGDLSINWPKYTDDECGSALYISPFPELRKFFPMERNFWEYTVPVIEMLTVQKGYQYYVPPVKCIERCSLNFKVAFFIALAIGILLILTLLTVSCMHCFKKTDSYQMNTGINCLS